GDGARPREGAAPHRRRREALVRPGRGDLARLGHRVSHQRRGPARGLRAGARAHRGPARPLGAMGARRVGRVRRRHRGAGVRTTGQAPPEGFVPPPGRTAGRRVPGGPWVRDDSGVYAGATVPRFYDTLMAKLIVWGPDRDAAVARMRRALGEYRITGVRSTIPVLERIMADGDFAAGRLHTGFMERLLGAGIAGGPARGRPAPAAAA